MQMHRFLMTTALALVMGTPAAMAEDVALVLGTDRYESIDRFARGTEIVTAAEGLSQLGFNVIALPNGRTANTAAALSDFLDAVPDAERIVVALSGRFVTDGERSWLLTADVSDPGLLSLGDQAVSIDALMTVLARAQGKAILLLGLDVEDTGAIDPWLRLGVAELDPPQGVTVLAGGPRVMAELIEGTLATPGADIAQAVADSGRIAVAGYLPSSFVFLPEDRAEIPVAPVEVDESAIEEERAFWTGVVALDTVDAYRNYLNAYPQGIYAGEAEEAIAAIIAEPNRDARLAEESLNLPRDARRDIQRNLTLLGFETRGIDGIFGQATRGAIVAWQQENGFPQTGYVTAEQINRLDAQAARRAAQLEAEAARQAQIAAAADRAFWDETGARGDEAGLRAYLERYPDGLFSETAEQQLARIEEAKRDEAEAADRAAWDRARQADTVAAYRAYLREFPEGAFREEAQARVRVLAEDSEVAGRLAEARAVEQALGLNRATLQIVEARLEQLDLAPGEVDGVFNRDSRRAIRNYQRDRGLEVTGFLDEATLVRLLADGAGGN
jgi:peptidoglycan hydrolase-like protein with peptidoglycan-binding domain